MPTIMGMRMRAPAVALLVVATTTMLGGQALAAAQKTGAASVGSVSVTLGGVDTDQDAIAPCTTRGTNSTAATTPAPGIAYGAGSTACTVDADTGEAGATASGKRFKLSVLRQYGGPVIALTSWSVRCATDGTGSTASMSLAGLTGVTVPSSIPVDYAVTVPGRHAGDPALAKVVFNELVTPDPADGSMTMNLMHVTLFPDTPNSPDHGDVVLGSASCDPND